MVRQATVVLGGLFLLHLALVCDIVSLSTPHWINGALSENSTIEFNTTVDTNGTNLTVMGLWEACQEGECVRLNATTTPEWFKAVQYQFTIATVMCLVALVSEYVFFIVNSCSKSLGCNILISVLLMVTTALQITSLGIFSAKAKKDDFVVTDSETDWSFFLAIVGTAITGLASFANIWEGCLLSSHRAAYESI